MKVCTLPSACPTNPSCSRLQRVVNDVTFPPYRAVLALNFASVNSVPSPNGCRPGGTLNWRGGVLCVLLPTRQGHLNYGGCYLMAKHCLVVKNCLSVEGRWFSCTGLHYAA